MRLRGLCIASALQLDGRAASIAQQHAAQAKPGAVGVAAGLQIQLRTLPAVQPPANARAGHPARELGQILGMFSQGTVALLSSRSILKRGVKADMTMVLDDANNPFKLLPTGKTVLIQMFGTPMPGFMPPTKSVRDALIDLQAHQLGMISGIRAIIAAMLQSFNPEQLEEQAKQNGMTSRLALPGSRKAALWDYFVRSYGETAGEIEDDFHTLFGEAFLHAYDMEVNQYKDSQSGSEDK